MTDVLIWALAVVVYVWLTMGFWIVARDAIVDLPRPLVVAWPITLLWVALIVPLEAWDRRQQRKSERAYEAARAATRDEEGDG